MTYIVAIITLLLATVGIALISFFRILRGRQNYFSWCDDEYQENIS